MIRPAVEPHPPGMGVPRFALLETRGPDPLALLLSPVILAALISLPLILGRFPSVARTPRAETITLLVAPPELKTLPDISTVKNPSILSAPLPPAPEPITANTPSREQTETQPASLKTDPVAPELIAAEPVPPEVVEKPAPVPLPPARNAAASTPVAAPAVVEAPNPAPAPVPLSAGNNVVPREPLPAPENAVPTRASARDGARPRPESLGGVPLAELIDDQAGLAAGLAALPSSERLSLPRVSIRVNAEWLNALPKTQERLYFSITTPEADREVLAYVPGTHSFILERPQQPLWQIHDGERVPALVELRAAAGRWLAVSPNLVCLYTWHPPEFEDALRMFVLERMQELRVHLGPRDVVTVRLASGSGGAVMNLEPIRADASQ